MIFGDFSKFFKKSKNFRHCFCAWNRFLPLPAAWADRADGVSRTTRHRCLRGHGYSHDQYLHQLPDHPTKNLFISSMEQLKEKKIEDALKILLDIVRIDKAYNDDMPRKTCLAIFKYLGDSNEITKRYRSLLNAALY